MGSNPVTPTKEEMEKIKKTLSRTNRFRHKLFRGSNLYFFVSLYFAVLTVVMVAYGQWMSPDRFIIAGVVLAIIVANPLNFIRDWLPFLLLLLSYEFLRGLAPGLNEKVNIYPLIDADKFLFHGHLPPVDLQRLLYVPGSLHFYDYIFSVLYMLHFALPLIFGFFLWVKKRESFRNFAIAILALSYVGFATYVIYPAMPPWMAAEKGIIPPVYNIFSETASRFLKGGSLPSVYWMFNPNPVAAMPSLHAAYPMLVFLYLLKYVGKKMWYFSTYVLGVWVAIVYLGHHYVIDALAGAIYAVVIFYAIEYYFSWQKQKLSQTVKVEASIEG